MCSFGINKIGFEQKSRHFKIYEKSFHKAWWRLETSVFLRRRWGRTPKEYETTINPEMVDPKRTVLHPVHNTLEILGNAVLFLRSGIPSAVIRHESGSFWKRSHHDSHVISLTKFSSNTNAYWPVIVRGIFKFLWRNVNWKHLMCFQDEASISKYL